MPMVMTWRWKPGAPIAVFGERWCREPDGSIVAEYTVEELQLCLAVAGHDFTQEQLLAQGGKDWKMKHEWPLEQARLVAQKLEAGLRPDCTQTLIAGSVRREKAWVKDVEIVVATNEHGWARSKQGKGARQTAMFEEDGDGLDVTLAQWVNDGVLRVPTKDGERYKQFEIDTTALGVVGQPEWGPLKLDLFIVRPPAQWGAIAAIRTGPADYSKWLVTKYPYGAMPADMKLEAGALWRFGKVIETPTEEEFFRRLGLAWEVPSQRRAGYNRLLVNG